ncbi:hypothetical protein HK105_201400 [Polyrhizophydium stewartii]|uniref:Uncharacterized protein n=1 Tax=Polyrhizophydium stewartii TaxID=2732419 RepID=A0ABR4NHY1_9FUNG
MLAPFEPAGDFDEPQAMAATASAAGLPWGAAPQKPKAAPAQPAGSSKPRGAAGAGPCSDAGGGASRALDDGDDDDDGSLESTPVSRSSHPPAWVAVQEATPQHVSSSSSPLLRDRSPAAAPAAVLWPQAPPPPQKQHGPHAQLWPPSVDGLLDDLIELGNPQSAAAHAGATNGLRHAPAAGAYSSGFGANSYDDDDGGSDGDEDDDVDLVMMEREADIRQYSFAVQGDISELAGARVSALRMSSPFSRSSSSPVHIYEELDLDLDIPDDNSTGGDDSKADVGTSKSRRPGTPRRGLSVPTPASAAGLLKSALGLSAQPAMAASGEMSPTSPGGNTEGTVGQLRRSRSLGSAWWGTLLANFCMIVHDPPNERQ